MEMINHVTLYTRDYNALFFVTSTSHHPSIVSYRNLSMNPDTHPRSLSDSYEYGISTSTQYGIVRLELCHPHIMSCTSGSAYTGSMLRSREHSQCRTD